MPGGLLAHSRLLSSLLSFLPARPPRVAAVCASCCKAYVQPYARQHTLIRTYLSDFSFCCCCRSSTTTPRLYSIIYCYITFLTVPRSPVTGVYPSSHSHYQSRIGICSWSSIFVACITMCIRIFVCICVCVCISFLWLTLMLLWSPGSDRPPVTAPYALARPRRPSRVHALAA